MAHVRLDNVRDARGTQADVQGSVQVLAAAPSGDPLYVRFDRPQGKVVVLTVNLDKGDLPLQTAFPIMATNALAWFWGTRGELRESIAAGAATEVEVPLKEVPPDSARDLSARARRRRPSASRGVGRLTVGPLDQCGVWSIVSRRAGAARTLVFFTSWRATSPVARKATCARQKACRRRRDRARSPDSAPSRSGSTLLRSRGS